MENPIPSWEAAPGEFVFCVQVPWAKIVWTIRNEIEAKSQVNAEKKDAKGLSPDINLDSLKKIKKLSQETFFTKDQTAILFHYLMEKNIIFPFDDQSISRLVSILTGYSENSLRQKAFGHIYDIMNHIPHTLKKKGKSSTNLQIVRDALQSLVDEINEEIEKRQNKK